MKIAKIIALSGFGAVLLVGSLASAQYYNQYGYSYTTNPVYEYPAYQYPTYSSACPAYWNTLTVGMRGYQVTELQRYLAGRGYGQPVTGYYGAITAANAARACGGSYNPYPMPTPVSGGTFRLDRSFDLVVGETKHEYRGSLSITLNQLDSGYWYSYWSSPDAARITLGVSCPPGTYCATLWYPQQTFTLEEDESIRYMGYEVTVNELNRGSASFIVEDIDRDDDDGDASIDLTAPSGNNDFEQGDEMRIAWSVEDEPSNASVVLDLYTESDRFVGTIAIDDADDDSYDWDIPEAREYCTMQYPNGLCGYNLRGDFYIKARLVSGSGYGNSYEYDSDDSGVFSIED